MAINKASQRAVLCYIAIYTTNVRMPKHIIIAESAVGGEIQYISTSRGGGGLTDEATDAALFASEAAAETAARKLLTMDFERKNDVTLSLGTITFAVASTTPLRRAPVRTGFVIRREAGTRRDRPDYYKGPKTIAPRSFRDAHYAYVENRDAATVFPSREKADSYGERCREILRETAERELKATRPSDTYQQLYEDFAFTVEAV